MTFLLFLSEFLIPFVFFYVIVTAMWKKVNCYECFIVGAKSGLKTVVTLCPTLIGLLTGVSVLRASGFLDFLVMILERPVSFLGFPAPLVPVTIVRMFSSSAATGMVLDLFRTYGTDSKIGLTASISMSCTETIFYTMSVYFLTAKVKNTRYTLPGALLATFSGLIASVLIAGLL